jgi:hypothetical protein
MKRDAAIKRENSIFLMNPECIFTSTFLRGVNKKQVLPVGGCRMRMSTGFGGQLDGFDQVLKKNNTAGSEEVTLPAVLFVFTEN